MRTQFNKDTGPKPSKQLLRLASTLAKPNTDDHLVVAMALRPNGVTQAEVITLLGHPHRNKLRKLLQDNKVKQYVLPEGGRSTRIRLVKK
jgi:gamma-glutamyl phosphate reductase